MTHISPDIPIINLFPIPRANDKLSRTSQIFPLRILRVKPNATPPQRGKDTPPWGGREQVSLNSNKVGKLRRVVKDERLSICQNEEGTFHSCLSDRVVGGGNPNLNCSTWWAPDLKRSHVRLVWIWESNWAAEVVAKAKSSWWEATWH